MHKGRERRPPLQRPCVSAAIRNRHFIGYLSGGYAAAQLRAAAHSSGNASLSGGGPIGRRPGAGRAVSLTGLASSSGLKDFGDLNGGGRSDIVFRRESEG